MLHNSHWVSILVSGSNANTWHESAVDTVSQWIHRWWAGNGLPFDRDFVLTDRYMIGKYKGVLRVRL